MFFVYLLSFLFACFASWFILLSILPFLSRYYQDAPNVRSSHKLITPRGGGIAFVIVVTVLSILLAPLNGGLVSLPLAAFPLAVIGLVDDRCTLPARLRYLVQIFTALLLVLSSSLPFPFVWLGISFLVIATTAIINFINFMDGVDGLVAGCMVVLFTSALAASGNVLGGFSHEVLLLVALIGALVGFLIWNWSPAKIFMGDVGSTFLGAMFAGVVLQAANWPQALALLLLATPLLGDAFFCVLRRLLVGQPIFQAHRLRLFQRLHQAGGSHARVSFLYIAATSLLSFALLMGGLPCVLGFAVTELLVGLWLDQRVAVPFAVASRK